MLVEEELGAALSKAILGLDSTSLDANKLWGTVGATIVSYINENLEIAEGVFEGYAVPTDYNNYNFILTYSPAPGSAIATRKPTDPKWVDINPYKIKSPPPILMDSFRVRVEQKFPGVVANHPQVQATSESSLGTII